MLQNGVGCNISNRTLCDELEASESLACHEHSAECVGDAFIVPRESRIISRISSAESSVRLPIAPVTPIGPISPLPNDRQLWQAIG